jgi:hypothetical protein
MDFGDRPQLHPRLDEMLQRLPWFRDLTREHRSDLLAEVVDQLVVDASSEEFTALLVAWSAIAHRDLKWSRFALLRESGLLEPPAAA